MTGTMKVVPFQVSTWVALKTVDSFLAGRDWRGGGARPAKEEGGGTLSARRRSTTG